MMLGSVSRVARELLHEASRDLAPTLIVVALFQAFFIQRLPDSPGGLIGGFAVVLVGLALFVKGLDAAIFPAGETMAFDFARRGSFVWLMLFAFCISFASVAAEPALMAVAYKAEVVSGGSMGALTLRLVAGLGVGLAVVGGVWRIVAGDSIGSYLVPGYLVVIALTWLAPPQLVGLAFDSGGVVASTVTAPLLTALGVGLATSIRGRNPLLDGFGLIAFGALAPMVIIQLYGIVFFEPPAAGTPVVMMPSDDQHQYVAVEMLIDFLIMVRNLLPIIAVVLFSSFVILRRPLADPKGLAVGMVLVAVGLFLFDEGLQVGLFPLGDEMTNGLMRDGVAIWAIHLYGFLIGFATTMAEPALIALSIKADEVSLGQLDGFWLRCLVSIGVGIGIVIGCARILHGTNIAYWLIPGYLLVLAMAVVAPRFIVPIAFDCGGVTTSTVTVPLVTALGVGLAERTPGRDPMIDGFGLIAFASLLPMIIVMAYGMLATWMLRTRRTAGEEGE
ncbi:DUF1538 domain-containing protein [Accumulibacter sp.]|uniref:DUF1538 domain-containing protein n=1 Tax=Accumulibacter sp. TaxID=2053492 RepID=UPI0025CBAFF1|nr:DUF1538 domain-containing protein [Accumulibacter sp.]MCM8594799.1 DUF1538 domain-containing protein [Accumulibacter sp.]MCM8625096.1 DUF1538 domain-containing protein [Accumulibacter sp.]MDS4048944.1 DUF1538 domain-containing protein [Accumulibacter sp.]